MIDSAALKRTTATAKGDVVPRAGARHRRRVDAFDVAVQTLLKTNPTVDGSTLRDAFATTATAFPGVTGTIRLDAAGDQASAPYAYWSICQPKGRKAQWSAPGHGHRT
ncbi:MAG TPA: hypothetical protein VLV81_08845 [Acidimicrobiia bacterium]|nr:hypothetical protein [Acidimicrobiia bacterium]